MFTYHQPTSSYTQSDYNHKENPKELCAIATRASEIFSSLTDAPTDTISIVLPNTAHLHATSKAAASVCIANPIDPQTDWRTMASVLRAAETKILVTVAPCASNTIWENVEKAIQNVPTISTIIYLDVNQFYSPAERLLTKAFSTLFGWDQLNRNGRKGYRINCQQFDFDELMGQMPAVASAPAKSNHSARQEPLMVRYAV